MKVITDKQFNLLNIVSKELVVYSNDLSKPENIAYLREAIGDLNHIVRKIRDDKN